MAPPNRMYNADERYGPAAIELDAEIAGAIALIMMRYAKAGWAMRDIEGVAMGAIRDVALAWYLRPDSRQWSGSPCPIAPDTCWVDDATGEHVNALTGARSKEHI